MEYVEVELGDVDIIQSTVQSILDCVENEKNHCYQLPPSIYMVPWVFRELNPSSFNPRAVCIGPLHIEDKKLQEFERYKASCVHDLLHRLDTPTEETLQACVCKVNDLIDRIRACYAKWSMAMEVKFSRFPWLFWFWGKPTFRIPVLQLHDYSELLLRNLVAYEQSSLSYNFVTSYLIAMDMLVNTQRGVAMLVRSKVLLKNFG
ncbi:unnamed protein product [Lactuca saligna]|uniref:Uncharacterized protein n=1 Tax=Lactuca saligna TaxID=75948 RepID=A0AA35ZVV8_LACSI|nr:unnamed protein product [Lactuca saligna]